MMVYAVIRDYYDYSREHDGRTVEGVFETIDKAEAYIGGLPEIELWYSSTWHRHGYENRSTHEYAADASYEEFYSIQAFELQ